MDRELNTILEKLSITSSNIYISIIKNTVTIVA